MAKRTPTESASFLIPTFGQTVTRAYAAKLRKHGIGPEHAAVLSVAAEARTPGPKELGASLGLPPSSVLPLLQELEALGALRRGQIPGGRRDSVELTRAGRTLLNRCDDLAAELDAEALKALTLADRALLLGLLGRVAQNLRKDRRPRRRVRRPAKPRR